MDKFEWWDEGNGEGWRSHTPRDHVYLRTWREGDGWHWNVHQMDVAAPLASGLAPDLDTAKRCAEAAYMARGETL